MSGKRASLANIIDDIGPPIVFDASMPRGSFSDMAGSVERLNISRRSSDNVLSISNQYLTSMTSRIPPSPPPPPSKADLNRCVIETYVNPALWLTTLFGFGQPRRNAGSLFKFFYCIYSICVYCLGVFLIVRMIAMVDWRNAMFNWNKVSMLTWCVQVVCSCITTTFALRSGRLAKLWRMCVEYGFDDILARSDSLRSTRRIAKCLNAAFLLLWVTLFMSFMFAYMGIQIGTFTAVFFSEQLDYLMIYPVLCSTCVWYAVQLLFVTICYYISKVWLGFGQLLEQRMQTGQSVEASVDWGLKTHRRLLRVSRFFSDTFGFYVLGQLAFSVPTLVIGTYLMTQTADPVTMLSLAVWVVAAISQISVICYAAWIHSAALSIKDKFFDIYVEYSAMSSVQFKSPSVEPTANGTVVVMQKSIAFLISLQSEDVGVTVCDMSLLNKAFVLTIFSVMFNYFFLLVQFAQDELKISA